MKSCTIRGLSVSGYSYHGLLKGVLSFPFLRDSLCSITTLGVSEQAQERL